MLGMDPFFPSRHLDHRSAKIKIKLRGKKRKNRCEKNSLRWFTQKKTSNLFVKLLKSWCELLVAKRWQKVVFVGVASMYIYIYTYTSSILHGYKLILTSLLVSMGISTFTSKEFVIFCRVSKIGNVWDAVPVISRLRESPVGPPPNSWRLKSHSYIHL